MIDKSRDVLINSLKGRVSKALGIRTPLSMEELSGLEEIYYSIDDLILSNKKPDDYARFEEDLAMYSKFIDTSKKTYITKHILPLISKVRTSKWESK